jgi:erythromycin esterase-like protein
MTPVETHLQSRRPVRLPWAVFLMTCACLIYPGRAAGQAPTITGIGPVVRDLCDRSVALIGESPVHGFGRTLEFKVELVRRLIDRCHYNAFFLESGLYDFLNIQEQVRSGRDVTDSMIAAAIGGLWANKEVQPLIPFLRERAKSGSVYLGGLDDQLGMGTWAQHEMPSALAAYLPGEQRAGCLAILRRHTLWQYTSDSPYGPQDKARILVCLDSIGAHVGDTRAPGPGDALAMVESLRRQFDRNFQNVPAGMDANTLGTNERDRSMYLNFHWLLSRLPPGSKVIVWTATVHAARELSNVPGDASRIPFGFYIHRDFGSRAFTLGFSAYSGSYAMVGQPERQLSPAPPGSLEGQSFARRAGNAVYLSRRDLRRIGPIPARPLGTTFTTAPWDQVLDGLVIFRQEQAPHYLGH